MKNKYVVERIRVIPESTIDGWILEKLMEKPGATEEMEDFINEVTKLTQEEIISTEYNGARIFLERVKMPIS